MSEKLLTLDEAAEYLDIHPGTLYRWARIKRVPAVKMGRVWRFRKEKIEEWIDKLPDTNDIKSTINNNVSQQKIEVADSNITEFLRGFKGVETSLRTKIKLYKKKAQEIEHYLSEKPEEWGKFQSQFNAEVDGIFRDIMNYEKINFSNGTKNKIEKLKRIFINRIRSIFLKGIYNRWSLTKPYGYAGDFKIIDDIYQNNPTSIGFERLFDNYFQMSAVSVAVRNRKDDFKRIIIKFVNDRRGSPTRIMNFASGPCREALEILTAEELTNKNLIFDCYDHEKKAIEYAEKLLNGNQKVNFIKENALRIAATQDINQRIKEKYDMIYATGLFDYFSSKISIKLITNLSRLLNPNGVLVISSVRDKYSNPSVHYMEWVGDWRLIYRNEEEFKKLFIDSGFKEGDLRVRYEQQGIMQYIIATNNKT
jgi:excisionase family DNA binding protein